MFHSTSTRKNVLDSLARKRSRKSYHQRPPTVPYLNSRPYVSPSSALPSSILLDPSRKWPPNSPTRMSTPSFRWLLVGERILASCDNVRLKRRTFRLDTSPDEFIYGKCFLTTYRVVFYPVDRQLTPNEDVLSILSRLEQSALAEGRRTALLDLSSVLNSRGVDEGEEDGISDLVDRFHEVDGEIVSDLVRDEETSLEHEEEEEVNDLTLDLGDFDEMEDSLDFHSLDPSFPSLASSTSLPTPDLSTTDCAHPTDRCLPAGVLTKTRFGEITKQLCRTRLSRDDFHSWIESIPLTSVLSYNQSDYFFASSSVSASAFSSSSPSTTTTQTHDLITPSSSIAIPQRQKNGPLGEIFVWDKLLRTFSFVFHRSSVLHVWIPSDPCQTESYGYVSTAYASPSSSPHRILFSLLHSCLANHKLSLTFAFSHSLALDASRVMDQMEEEGEEEEEGRNGVISRIDEIRQEFTRQWLTFVSKGERERRMGVFEERFPMELDEWRRKRRRVENGLKTPAELASLLRLQCLTKSSNSDWRLSEANRCFQLSPSYPMFLAVPAALSDDDLSLVASNRTSGRIPTLVWKHPNDPCAFLARASAPLEFSPKDHEMLAVLKKMSGKGLIHVVDCRSGVASDREFSYSLGGGRVRTTYLSLETTHSSLRSSLFSLLRLLRRRRQSSEEELSPVTGSSSPSSSEPSPRRSNYIQGLGKSLWFRHIVTLLQAASRVSLLLAEDKVGMILQDSSGRDQSAQVSSLSQLLIDPFYRTIDGFRTLVEKEWISLGFPFTKRHQPTQINQFLSEECSPLFLQFLDSVLVLWTQYPNQFEFDPSLIAFLGRHVYSGHYGDFLCNSEKDRLLLNVPGRTESVWRAIEERRSKFCNPLYRGDATMRLLLRPTCSIQKVSQSFYSTSFLFHSSSAVYSTLKRVLGTAREEVDGLSRRAERLRERLRGLQEH